MQIRIAPRSFSPSCGSLCREIRKYTVSIAVHASSIILQPALLFRTFPWNKSVFLSRVSLTVSMCLLTIDSPGNRRVTVYIFLIVILIFVMNTLYYRNEITKEKYCNLTFHCRYYKYSNIYRNVL